jgi:hypothetical protein
MLNKSLFICYSTPNYSKLTNIFLDSLRDLNVKNINHIIENPPSNLLQRSGFQSNLWYYCVRNKINHLINVLKEHTTLDSDSTNIQYFIFTDCDIMFFKKNIHEWNNLEKDIVDEGKDIYFMRDGSTSNNVNSGFFVIKNNSNIKNIIYFFIEVLNTMDITTKNNMPFGDQSIINNLKHTINYGFIPNDYIILGKEINNKNKSLFHHAVCCKDVDDKILQINYIKSTCGF